MAASIETLTLLSGSYWSPAGDGATITYTIEGPTIVNELGQTISDPDFTFVESVQLALEAWSNVADLTFEYIPSSGVDLSNPFAANPNNADIVFTFGYDPEVFYQSGLISTNITKSPEADKDQTITHSTILVNELLYQDGDLMPGPDTSFITLVNSIGISLGLAWGRGIEDFDFLESLTEYQAELEIYNNIDLPIYLAQLEVYNAEFAAYQIAVDAYVAGGAVGEPPEAPESPEAPEAPEPPQEPVSDFPSFDIDFGTGEPLTFVRSEAILDNTLMVQQMLTGSDATFGEAAGGRPLGPQIWDVEAIQFLYGVNQEYQAWDNYYDYSDGAQRAQTLWDAGGQDIISAFNHVGDTTIDLREDEDSITTIGNTRIWIMGGANIEEAIGGLGDDTVTGNHLDNIIRTYAGDDLVNAGAGSDFINGNQGQDAVNGGDGNDTVRGGKDEDTVNGENGDDFVAGDKENDIVNGNDGNDFIRGGRENDTINGGAGVDFIYGDRDNDQLTGGTGNDFFVFHLESGVDTITDFEGAATTGGDIIQISSNIYDSAAEVLSNFSGSTIDLGNGATITLTGITSLTADDIQIF